MSATLNSEALSATGSFDHAALGSTRRFDASAVLDTDRTIHGLTPEAGYIWGTVRDEDDHVYIVMRRVPARPDPEADVHSHSLGGKLIVAEGGDGQQLNLRREPRFAPDSAELRREVVDADTVTFSAPANDQGRSTSLTLSTDAFSYQETDVIDVTGALAVPPLQWFLPGPESSLLYLSQTWLVEGTLLGKAVKGFLFWEEAWMPEGGRLYIANDPILDARYLTWYSWANQWEDDSIEVGHFLFGNDQFGVAVTSRSDGTGSSDGATMEATITRAEDGYWHNGIRYTIAGEEWVCEPDPHGRMEGLGKLPNPQQEGRMHRVSDTRKPKVWMAWGETVPAAGEVRGQHES